MNLALWYLSDLWACGHVRAEAPARVINRRSGAWRVICKTDCLLSDLFAADVMIFQRQHKPDMLAKLRTAKKWGIRTVYDLDDDMFEMPEEFDEPYRFFSQPEVQHRMRLYMHEADAVTVSTEVLRERYAAMWPEVNFRVVPNALDIDRWETGYTLRQSAQDREEVVIGWMASGSHKIDAPLVMEALARLMRENPKVHLHLIGWVGWDELGKEFQGLQDRILTEPWVAIEELPLRMANFDIGLCPLQDNRFNRAKSNIKALQYWAVGAVPVASPLPPYDCITPGADGLYCDMPQSWYRGLSDLVEDAEARRRMAATGRLKLLSEWDLDKRAHEWITAWQGGKNHVPTHTQPAG